MKVIFIFCVCCFLPGCVTLTSVKEDLRKVDYSDGVDEKEAVAIARMSMINSRLHGDYQLWACNVYHFVGYWKVVFLSLHFNKHACVLVIEKNTGDILAFFEALDAVEAATGSNPAYSVEDWKRIRKFY